VLPTQINQRAAVLITRRTAGRDLADVYMVIGESGQAGIGLDEISRQFQIVEAAERTADLPLVAGDEISAQAVADLIGLGIVARTDDGKYQATVQIRTCQPICRTRIHCKY